LAQQAVVVLVQVVHLVTGQGNFFIHMVLRVRQVLVLPILLLVLQAVAVAVVLLLGQAAQVGLVNLLAVAVVAQVQLEH
jgi:hypothetical protein